jgi:hypothetical protein
MTTVRYMGKERSELTNVSVERRGSTESVEDMLLREVEREREDKLCVICVDKEKCIMILPCRYSPPHGILRFVILPCRYRPFHNPPLQVVA